MDALEVFVATHLPVPMPEDPYFRCVQAGAAIHPRLDLPGDDTGENISARNVHYSELTVLYWAWKNSRARAAGLMHYRRMMEPKDGAFTYAGHSVASGEDLLHTLETCNIILVEPWIFYHPNTTVPRSLEQQYVADHDGADLIQARRTVGDICPGYLPAFDFVMRNNRLVAFNMMVAHRDVFDAYSAWLFPLCFALEDVIPLATMSGYQARVMGFLGERLFTVWLAHNRRDLVPSYRALVKLDAG